MSYAWTITKDHIADENAQPGTNCNAVGVIGPRGCQLSAAQIREHPDRQYFAMYDDDGERYYDGYFVDLGGEDYNEAEFAPLDDFGEPNAGATEIRYRNASGEMRQL